MPYKFSSLKPILDILASHGELTVKEISMQLDRSTAIIHKYLLALVAEGKVIKKWTAPHTTYTLKNYEWKKEDISPLSPSIIWAIPYADQRILNDIFTKFSPIGKRYDGAMGWIIWCQERWLDPIAKSKNYLQIAEHLHSLEDSCGLLRATDAYSASLGTRWLDELYYADQYTWMEFGRGRLAEIAFYAKQSQNKSLIRETIDIIIPRLLCMIRSGGYDAIAITPWSIERRNQLLWYLWDALRACDIPFVRVIKYYENSIRIPQKSLKTRNERIQNARNTIYVDDKNISGYKKVLLIDDFVGSGATMNETAKKLKDEGVQVVIGFALVGNLNLSYEVINEI
jgi:phosphoribosylpyrophosphate synthetase